MNEIYRGGCMRSSIISVLIVFSVFVLASCVQKNDNNKLVCISEANDLFKRARAFTDTRNFEDALKLYKEIIEKYPESDLVPVVQYSIARCYRDLGDDKKAIIEFQLFLKLYPNHELSYQAEVFTGDLLQKEKDYSSAIKHYRNALSSGKNGEYFSKDKVQFKLALSYQEMSGYNQAIREYLKIIRKSPESEFAVLSMLNVAYCYIKMGDETKAKEYLKWIIVKDKDSDEAKLAVKILNEIDKSNSIGNIHR